MNRQRIRSSTSLAVITLALTFGLSAAPHLPPIASASATPRRALNMGFFGWAIPPAFSRKTISMWKSFICLATFPRPR